MDEINYRRVIALPKCRCEDCGATCYHDRDQIFRCVVCDHELFETCLDCGQLVGWCECEPAVKTTSKRNGTNGKAAPPKAAPPKKKATRAKPAPVRPAKPAKPAAVRAKKK